MLYCSTQRIVIFAAASDFVFALAPANLIRQFDHRANANAAGLKDERLPRGRRPSSSPPMAPVEPRNVIAALSAGEIAHGLELSGQDDAAARTSAWPSVREPRHVLQSARTAASTPVETAAFRVDAVDAIEGEHVALFERIRAPAVPWPASNPSASRSAPQASKP